MSFVVFSTVTFLESFEAEGFFIILLRLGFSSVGFVAFLVIFEGVVA